MLPAYEPLVAELRAVADSFKNLLPTNNPVSIHYGDRELPGITRNEMVNLATGLIDRISATTLSPSDVGVATLTGLVQRLEFLRINTVPNIATEQSAIPAYLITMDMVEQALLPFLVDQKAKALSDSNALKKVGIQIRAMEARVKGLKDRSADLEGMVERIEKAHNAADQLPTDLETLGESQKKVSMYLAESEKDRAHVASLRESIEAIEKLLSNSAEEAALVLARCESAYSSATSLGLGAAFTERSVKLDHSMWAWVGGLIASLLAGGYFGTAQLTRLSQLISTPDPSSSMVVLNLMLTALSVGAPIWFAWLSTKQIGQRFRLSEDYAFKASISRAYEGYRREAARIDPHLETQLLQSALSRLDEQPLRLVENDSFGSPWHELLSSDVIKDAVKSVPGFVDRMSAMASSALQKKPVPNAIPSGSKTAARDTPAESEESKA